MELAGTYTHLVPDRHSCVFSLWCSRFSPRYPLSNSVNPAHSQLAAKTFFNHPLPRAFPNAIFNTAHSSLITGVVTVVLRHSEPAAKPLQSPPHLVSATIYPPYLHSTKWQAPL